jgi:transcriptional regulator with XRE-family HTH domain
MYMQLNTQRVRMERELRGWSQEHLAATAGLSTRTIQRVEASGIASSETATALAAVFGLALADLRSLPSSSPSRPWRRRLMAALGSAGLVAVGLLIASQAQAAKLLLDMGLTLGDETPRPSQVIVQDGREAEVRVDGAWRVTVVPTIRRDGSIGLGLQLYRYDGQRYVLVAHPQLVTGDNSEAELRVGDGPDDELRVTITPHRI